MSAQNLWKTVHTIAPLVLYGLLPSARVCMLGLLMIPRWTWSVPSWADWLKRFMMILLVYRGLVPTTTFLGLGYRMFVDATVWIWVLQGVKEREMLGLIPYDEIARDVVRKQTWTTSDRLMHTLRTHGILFRDYCLSVFFFLGITGFRNRLSVSVVWWLLNVFYIHGFVPTFLLVQSSAIVAAYIQNLPYDNRPPQIPFFADTLRSYFEILFRRTQTIEIIPPPPTTVPISATTASNDTKEAIRRLDDILSQTLLDIFSLPPPKEKHL